MLILPAVSAQQWLPRGITEPYKDATLSPSVSGIISTIRKREGETVKQGEVIVEMDTEYETLEAERRRLIAESKIEVEAARYRLDMLKLDLDSTQTLYDSTQSVSLEELLQKELEYRMAQAELESLLKAEEREELELKIAQAQLEKRVIRAPFDGIVVSVLLEEGESCSPQQSLVRVVDVRKCRLIVHVEAATSRKMKTGTRVQVRIEDAQSPITLWGAVEFASPVVDPSSGLREIKVVFDNDGGKIFPGATGTLIVN
jgi:RND family efflux transporter MFP subunit